MARLPEKCRLVELETDRFRLVPIRPLSLALATFHWTRDPELFAGFGWRTSGWTLRRWWRQLRRQVHGSRQCHGIWPKAGGPCIGLHLLGVSAGARTATIGIIIGEKEWWGKGVVSEVREAVVDDCFERMKMERVWGQVHARNLASVYNYRKLGFVHEGTLRAAVPARDGKRIDMIIFGVLRDEWFADRIEHGGDDA